MACCSACMEVTYCDRQCQRNHWKDHKVYCRQCQHFNKNVPAPKLFREWLKRVRHTALEKVIFRSVQAKEDPESVLLFRVAFDYNLRTFMPVGPVETKDVSSLDAFDQQSIRIKRNEVQAKGQLLKILVLLYHGEQIKIQCIVGKEVKVELEALGPAPSWDFTLESFERITLPIPSASNWPTLRGRNIKFQIDSLRTSNSFGLFIISALRIGTTQSRHKTHAVVIHYELGHGLGEIASLSSFEVLELKKAWSLHSSVRRISQQQLDYDKANVFDIERSPILLKQRIQSGRNTVLLPVTFVNSSYSVSYALPLLLVIADMKLEKVNVNEGDEMVAEFRNLQQVRFPKVTNPPLDD